VVPSQRLSSGELAFVASGVPQFGKATYSINHGKAFSNGKAIISLSGLANGIYSITIDGKTGDISKLVKTEGTREQVLVDSAGFNRYIYMPGDSIQRQQTSTDAVVTIKEKGPLLVSLLITSKAPGTHGLTREIRLVNGLDKIELINTIDKKSIRAKESVHFAFPFNVPGAQVRYSIPWSSVTAEADQLPNANKNWFTMQRWVDVSNASFGITWSSPDAPLFEIGKITTADLLGGLHHAPQWLTFTPQSSRIYSWVMNNLWHTNFRAEQEKGPATFHYIFRSHPTGYDGFDADRFGLNNHQPLVVAAASGNLDEQLFFNIDGKQVYVESLKPADDGNGVIAQIVSTGDSDVTITSKTKSAIKIWKSNLTEEKVAVLDNNFKLPVKGIITVRIEK
jgi:alpha-mannosidase